jgi:hypothetical protein
MYNRLYQLPVSESICHFDMGIGVTICCVGIDTVLPECQLYFLLHTYLCSRREKKWNMYLHKWNAYYTQLHESRTKIQKLTYTVLFLYYYWLNFGTCSKVHTNTWYLIWICVQLFISSPWIQIYNLNDLNTIWHQADDMKRCIHINNKCKCGVASGEKLLCIQFVCHIFSPEIWSFYWKHLGIT